MSIEGREFICTVCNKVGPIYDIGVVESLDMARAARYCCLAADGTTLCRDANGRSDVVVLNEG